MGVCYSIHDHKLENVPTEDLRPSTPTRAVKCSRRLFFIITKQAIARPMCFHDTTTNYANVQEAVKLEFFWHQEHGFVRKDTKLRSVVHKR